MNLPWSAGARTQVEPKSESVLSSFSPFLDSREEPTTSFARSKDKYKLSRNAKARVIGGVTPAAIDARACLFALRAGNQATIEGRSLAGKRK